MTTTTRDRTSQALPKFIARPLSMTTQAIGEFICVTEMHAKRSSLFTMSHESRARLFTVAREMLRVTLKYPQTN